MWMFGDDMNFLEYNDVWNSDDDDLVNGYVPCILMI